VVYDAQRGLIVTNNHVLEHANDITVTLTDGRMLKAKRVGGDPDFDLAVISVPAERLTAMPFGDSRQLQVGDFVLAIGYPANMGQSVTSGIVSGLHRSNIGIEEFENFIQTDAAIYPGNSGGALVNLQGDLIGINTAFIGVTSSNPGMGLAIPVNMAHTIIDQIVEVGEIRRGSLGITINDPTPDVIRELKISAPQGCAVIVKVDPRSSGARAGLKSGDIVTEIGDRPVRDAAFLRTRLALLLVGDVAELAVLRDGKPLNIRATVAEPSPARKQRRLGLAVIQRWNDQLALGRDMLWSPTIWAAQSPALTVRRIAALYGYGLALWHPRGSPLVRLWAGRCSPQPTRGRIAHPGGLHGGDATSISGP
jgi:serine protease Do/serine protease DegQ